jgi:antitoxin component YwqK of YwqJK toxin-antitoxin module
MAADGTKHGPWFEYHPNGQIKTEGQYEKDQGLLDLPPIEVFKLVSMK